MIRLIPLLLVSVIAFAPETTEAGWPVGKWRGTWTSRSTGHEGPMRARIRQVDDDTYRGLFAGRFAGVIPFIYPAKLERVPGTCDRYRSTQRLPLMGMYRVDAVITPGRFDASFRSGNDYGSFNMVRRR